MSVTKNAPSRRRHTNSKLGCANCKRKKIRCDENLPECNNCCKAKRDQCSYLFLTPNEISKIKLTHSLRNSQNKLLDSDYRLPTSKRSPGIANNSNNKSIQKPKSDDKGKLIAKALETENAYGGIEFKRELAGLPIRIPTYDYPPLQYKTSTMNDFSSEFKVIYDTPEVEDKIEDNEDNVTSIRRGSPLPAAQEISIIFPKIRHRTRRFESDSRNFINQDDILSLISMQSGPHSCILSDLVLCLGRCIILKTMKNMSTSVKDLKHLNAFSRGCFEHHSQCLIQLKYQISEYNNYVKNSTNTQELASYLHLMTPKLYYATSFLSFCVLLLDFSMENYTKISSDTYKIINTYLQIVQKIPNYKPHALISSILTRVQSQFLFIKIPVYDTNYTGEVHKNLKSLAPFFHYLDGAVAGFETGFETDKLKHYYDKLVLFIEEEYIPILNHPSMRVNSDKLVNFPLHKVFNLFKKWLLLVPGECLVPKHVNVSDNDSEKTKELFLVKDFSSILYSYFHAIGISLKTIFPFAVYLFGMDFAPMETLWSHKEWFNISLTESELTQLLNRVNSNGIRIPLHKYNNVADFLQRHNYFNLRLHSFFTHRFKIYSRNSQWGVEYPQDMERFKDRRFQNIQEKPIKDFSLTLIRPEHYPTSVSEFGKDNKSHMCIRYDESMMMMFYTRNIETLDFFSDKYVLQFDFESMCLLRDYRPRLDVPIEKNPLTVQDMEYYLNDRRLITKELR